jgi:tRNA (guanosine-2'-O-)-methyltransferase
MELSLRQELFAFLAQYVSEHKLNRIDQVLEQRTRHLTILLEEIYQPHNASACVRSADCFGIQDVHILEERNPYKVNKDITLGSAKWISLHRYGPETRTRRADCMNALREAGYLIAATTLRPGAIPLQQVPLDRRLALCFGTEEVGLSDELHEAAEMFVHIPMVGFTQSFNISVSVALCLYELTGRLRQSEIPWHLTAAERERLRFEWVKRASNQGDALIRRFLQDRGLPDNQPVFED